MTRELEILEKKGSNAVRSLRLQKLQQGLPFMINSRDLPVGQCYFEYPDGSMALVALTETKHDFEIVRKLSISERLIISEKFQLL